MTSQRYGWRDRTTIWGKMQHFLLLPYGNSVPAHPDFDQGIEKIIFFYDSLVCLVASVPLNDVCE